MTGLIESQGFILARYINHEYILEVYPPERHIGEYFRVKVELAHDVVRLAQHLRLPIKMWVYMTEAGETPIRAFASQHNVEVLV